MRVALGVIYCLIHLQDKLIENLVKEALQRDAKENLDKAPRDRQAFHLENLVRAISSCGITFSVWENQNADGKGSGLYDFTSLTGTDKKILLEKLPSKLDGVISPGTSSTVINIWKDFSSIYHDFLQKDALAEEDVNTYFEKAKAWATLFLSLGGKLEGYAKANITPYIHAMVYHIPHFMRLHKGIRNFSGQGVEKLNDDCRRVHLEKSNKWDAAKDVLLAEERLINLSDLQKTPRQYKKKAEDYWSTGIRESRSKCPRLCDQVPSQDNEGTDTEDLSTLSPKTLRSLLKDLGIKTRAINVKRLLDMYYMAKSCYILPKSA